ncbi:hypothetical protein OGAPHI_006670 [Ogataea philodendri]|uniref:Uncharacterized protein n=1 Tax=Ogataea philodendri TaxID=1378263 RepID=A0A9P8T011_9ASCO|nr:uncharacterized protein OGAPHI_006670 [Ogataea philodendri]KAH3661263.1 hypothetical protein OGAPHI_006670 [Ogataea philodendri]
MAIASTLLAVSASKTPIPWTAKRSEITLIPVTINDSSLLFVTKIAHTNMLSAARSLSRIQHRPRQIKPTRLISVSERRIDGRIKLSRMDINVTLFFKGSLTSSSILRAIERHSVRISGLSSSTCLSSCCIDLLALAIDDLDRLALAEWKLDSPSSSSSSSSSSS